ncbi:MAG TPA: 16S rRNA (uracil(1498)-N(3))-methyltransferase [Syntrophales bacterium]|nr:16S rRNA (uracil(1498)-N(3))-methyltransferase [Syntrophales bacterium]
MTPRIYVSPLPEGISEIKLAEETVRYLRNVLRLGHGDEVLFFDGTGWEYQGVIERFEDRSGSARIVARQRIPLEIPVRITLAQSLPKGDKMEFIIQKATELGVARIIPFRSSRTVPRRTEERAAKRLERWRRIAAEAAEQCGRGDVPEITEALSFREALGAADSGRVKILFWEAERSLSIRDILKGSEVRSAKEFFLVVGPEGGLSEEEVQIARESGFLTASLGQLVLRVETAALAILTIIQYEYGLIGALKRNAHDG